MAGANDQVSIADVCAFLDSFDDNGITQPPEKRSRPPAVLQSSRQPAAPRSRKTASTAGSAPASSSSTVSTTDADGEPAPARNKVHECPWANCGKSFGSEQSLTTHMKQCCPEVVEAAISPVDVAPDVTPDAPQAKA